MSDNVVILPVVTSLDIPASRVLDAAVEEDFAQVVVIGWTTDGEEYFASSASDGGDVLWMIERAKMQLLRGDADG